MWLITSQRSVLVCRSCPLRGSRSRTFTSTRPPVGLRPFITWNKDWSCSFTVHHWTDLNTTEWTKMLCCEGTTRLPHFYDLSDFTLQLQFVQLDNSCPDWLVAPQETSGRQHNSTIGINRDRQLVLPLIQFAGEVDAFTQIHSLTFVNYNSTISNRQLISLCGSDPLESKTRLPPPADGSATHPLCISSNLRPRDATTLLKPRWLRLMDRVKLWLYSSEKKKAKCRPTFC